MTTDDAKSYLSKREIPRLFESLMTGLMYHRPSDHIQYLIDCLHKVHEKGQENITWSSFVDIRRSKTPLPPINNNDKKRPTSKGSSRPASRTKTPKGEEILTLVMGNFEDTLINRVMSPSPSERSITPLGDRVTSPLVRENGVLAPVRPGSAGRSSRGSNNRPIREEPPKQEFKTATPPLPAIQKDKISLPDVPIVLVMGAPGSGKDTHLGKLVARYPDWKHLNMGSLIKEEIQRRGDAHTKWKLTRDLMSRGEPAPEDVTIDCLVDALKGCKTAKGIIITGFPRNITQVSEFQQQVGRVDAAFMIDCEESSATERLLRRGKSSNRPEDTMAAIANRLNYFKANTLEAAKYFDDQGKLQIIDGDQNEETVSYVIGKAFDDMFFSKGGAKPVGDAPDGAQSIPEPASYKGKYEREESEAEIDKDAPLFPGAVPEPPTITNQDTGRKPGLPTCPIIFCAGGPGSGKGTQCSRIIQRYPGFVHISMGDVLRTEISTKGTVDQKWGMIATLVSKGEMAPEEETVHLLKEELKKHSDAKAFVVEGFPRDKSQVEAFNREIGGLNFVMLFDCEEFYMQTRLMKRGKESGRIDDNMSAIANRINFYKYNTLPVMRHFELEGKLVLLEADKDVEEMFYDISKLFDFAFFANTEDNKVSKLDESSLDCAVSRLQACFRGYMTRRLAQTCNQQEGGLDGLDLKEQGKRTSRAYVTQSTPNMSEQDLAVQSLSAGFMGLKLKQENKTPRSTTAKTQKNKGQRTAKKTIKKAFLAYEKSKNKNETTSTQSKQEKPDKGVDKSLQDTKSTETQVLQSAFVGLQKRQSNKSKPSDQNDQNDQNSDDMAEAALRIQAGFRGYKTRQELQAMKADKQQDKAQNESAPEVQAESQPETQAEAQPQSQTETEPEAQTEAEEKEAEVVEETIAPTEATTTGENVENPSHTQTLDQAAES